MSEAALWNLGSLTVLAGPPARNEGEVRTGQMLAPLRV
jgi:hypothetical protein